MREDRGLQFMKKLRVFTTRLSCKLLRERNALSVYSLLVALLSARL